MWKIDSILPDPLSSIPFNPGNGIGDKRKKPKPAFESTPSSWESFSCILSGSISIRDLLGDDDPSILSVVQGGDRGLCVALADFCARHFESLTKEQRNQSTIGNTISSSDEQHHYHQQQQKRHISIWLENLDEAIHSTASRRKSNGRSRRRPRHPYVMERSDFYCSSENDCWRLHVTVRAVVNQRPLSDGEKVIANASTSAIVEVVRESSKSILQRIFPCFGRAGSNDANDFLRKDLLGHIACVILQQKLRSLLSSSSSLSPQLENALAFVADGSILPRKSGTSDAPMASPPAVPIQSPSGSPMTITSLTIDMGSLAEHLPSELDTKVTKIDGTTIVLSGLLVPRGITLICGGGYHGKSTLLQALAVGHYDKIPGDGRELCVTIPDALTVRAEDGRYVNSCNISAFISNLPKPPGATTSLDTERFSTKDASGSTSQAANVSEAIELGARALLVDEDISAANFMARDGRMRALVMDESITPLLYRVNGLYNTHGISSIVVVGGVGDWLDVPHNVLLLDKYQLSDATAKARSISKQFSYGHVQYAGRGVVHRLEWDTRTGTPKPRRPSDASTRHFCGDTIPEVSLLDGGRGLVVYGEQHNLEEEDDEDEGYIDASRLGQLLGKKQLYATGLCVAWLLRKAPVHADAGLRDLLKILDRVLDKGGMNLLLKELNDGVIDESDDISSVLARVIESVGYLERPRNFEIGQALTRMRGVRFEELPLEDDGSEEAARLEEERRKKELADLWAKRRSKTKKCVA